MDAVNLSLFAISLPDAGQLLSVLITIVGLGMVIFLHELGHFAVAKWCDVHVERFSIGFGPILLGWKWGETEYALSAIPFGGYVKMLGQDDADPSQMTSEEIAADPRSYVAKNVWQRMAIISAGVTMNVITGTLFFAMAFGLGVESTPPVIGVVRPGLPAWQAGIQRGDRVTHIDGREVASFEEMALRIALSGESLTLEGTRRDGAPFKTRVAPDASGKRPQIGIGPSRSLSVVMPPKGAKIDAPTFPGTAASRAEPPIQFGDQIVAVDGVAVQTFAEFQDRLASRTAETVTLTVNRAGAKAGAGESVLIPVGANYFHRLGLRMDLGPFTAVQANSPAEKAGLLVGDKLSRINGRAVGTDIDPLRLPEEFARLAGQSVEVVVNRQLPKAGTREIAVQLIPENRPGWLEQPEREGDPIAVAAIGIAFHVLPHVLQIDPESPAAKAGVTPNAALQKIELMTGEGEKSDAKVTIILDDPKDPAKSNNWAYAFWEMQSSRRSAVQLTFTEKGATQSRTVSVTPEEDRSWPLPMLGVIMHPERQEELAHSVPQALSMGSHRSFSTILNIYSTLRSLFISQTLSYKELHGPIGIAQAAYQTAQSGMSDFLGFLGFLSLNLAVLNFLPIPVLDGGHMVFLMWEAVVRRRPSEKVMIGSMYVGMAFLLGLMALVLVLDVGRLVGH